MNDNLLNDQGNDVVAGINRRDLKYPYVCFHCQANFSLRYTHSFAPLCATCAFNNDLVASIWDIKLKFAKELKGKKNDFSRVMKAYVRHGYFKYVHAGAYIKEYYICDFLKQLNINKDIEKEGNLIINKKKEIIDYMLDVIDRHRDRYGISKSFMELPAVKGKILEKVNRLSEIKETDIDMLTINILENIAIWEENQKDIDLELSKHQDYDKTRIKECYKNYIFNFDNKESRDNYKKIIVNAIKDMQLEKKQKEQRVERQQNINDFLKGFQEEFHFPLKKYTYIIERSKNDYLFGTINLEACINAIKKNVYAEFKKIKLQELNDNLKLKCDDPDINLDYVFQDKVIENAQQFAKEVKEVEKHFIEIFTGKAEKVINKPEKK